jgi:hypothetical protein
MKNKKHNPASTIREKIKTHLNTGVSHFSEYKRGNDKAAVLLKALWEKS